MMFRPKIIGFMCNWSLPEEKYLVDNDTISGYPKMHIVPVMCIGRIDPVILLEAFIKGADGVLVVGCPPPDCHYVEGNLQAERKIKLVNKLLSRTGLEPERLKLSWGYTYEVDSFVKTVNDFRRQILTLGPSPLTGDESDRNILACMLAAKTTAEESRLRTIVGREREMVEERNVYGEKLDQAEFDEELDKSIEAEYTRNRIRLLVKDTSMSVVEMAECLGLNPRIVLRHVVVLRRRGLITLNRIEGNDPLYAALEVTW